MTYAILETSSSEGRPYFLYQFVEGVDGAAQHGMLLHSRQPVDPVVVGVGLEIPGDQAGRCVLPQLLQCQNAQIAVEQQKPGRIRIGSDH